MTPRAGTAIAGVLLLASACGTSSSSGKPATNPTQQQLINDGGTFDAHGKTTVQVTATNFQFSPSTILADPGQKVTLVIHNTSQTPHNITASGGVDSNIDPGATQTVTLTVPASGELVFVCSFHAASGMAGRLGPESGSGSATTPSTSPTAKSGGSGGYYRYGGTG